MTGDTLAQIAIFLTAAVICVPIASRLGLGSVLGYLLAGCLIGPFAMGFVGHEGSHIMHYAEFGVVVMLFLVGLELEPKRFWSMRTQVFGLGSLQVLGSGILLSTILLLTGLSWQAALGLGFTLSMSSTAIALQTLQERGKLQDPAGTTSFAILLFQDLSVIPLLALFPLLATHALTQSSANSESLGGIQQALLVLGAVGAVIAAGRWLVVPLLRFIAATRMRELFTASALLLVVGIAWLMQAVGLSAALGTFLAGVVLANSEFRHELEGDLEPFKGLLLGLFFMAVGTSIDFHLLVAHPATIALGTIGIVAVKYGILFLIGKWRGLSLQQNLLYSASLSQIGEFAFVLVAFLAQLNIIDSPLKGIWMAIVALSMTTTPILLLIQGRLFRSTHPAANTDTPDLSSTQDSQPIANHSDSAAGRVLIVGFSHFGSTMGRLLRASGVEATFLDYDSNQVTLLRNMGFAVHYGDAQRTELLEAAGAAKASILVCAMSEPSTIQRIVHNTRRHFPHLRILVRARNRYDAYELIDHGIQDIYRDTLDTSIRMTTDVLVALGHRSYTALRQGAQFRIHDEAALRELATHRKDKKTYIFNVRKQIAEQERILQDALAQAPNQADHSWDSEPLRQLMSKSKAP